MWVVKKHILSFKITLWTLAWLEIQCNVSDFYAAAVLHFMNFPI